MDLLLPHDFAPRRERDRRFPLLEHERFLERERERLDRDLFFPPREHERFLERERLDRDLLFPPRELERFLEQERLERDLLLPPREVERFFERERERLERDLLLPLLEREPDRFFPPLEQERFFDPDLDRLLPERERFIEPAGDFDRDFERDFEHFLAFAAAAARRFLAKALGQESQLLLSLLLLTFLVPLRDRLLGRMPSSSSACALLLRGIFEIRIEKK